MKIIQTNRNYCLLLIQIVCLIFLNACFHQRTIPTKPQISTERENCRLFGVVCNDGAPSDYLKKALKDFANPSLPQYSGWSIGYYSEYFNNGLLGIPGKPQIIRSAQEIEYDQEIFHSVSNLAIREFHNVIISHLRNASSGCINIADPHPFEFQVGEKTYLFAHNGGVWGNDLKMIVDDLLDDFSKPQTCPDTPIDSEYLALYLQKILTYEESHPFEACHIWLQTLLDHLHGDWNALNIILTDGIKIWTVRSSTTWHRFPLNYKRLPLSSGYMISTDGDWDWIALDNHSVGEFSVRYPPKIHILERHNPELMSTDKID